MNQENIQIVDFPLEDLKKIQENFHRLIVERAKTGWNCSEFLADNNKRMPEITNENQKGKEWFAVPGMYGGFAYQLFVKNGKPTLITESWSRVVGGSGQRHEITATGYFLVDEGFV